MREQIWEPSTENVYAHLRLSSFSDSVAGLPPEEVQVVLLSRATLHAHNTATKVLRVTRLNVGLQAMLAQRNARAAGPRGGREMVVDLDNLHNRLQNAPPEIQEELRNLVDQPEVQDIGTCFGDTPSNLVSCQKCLAMVYGAWQQS